MGEDRAYQRLRGGRESRKHVLEAGHYSRRGVGHECHQGELISHLRKVIPGSGNEVQTISFRGAAGCAARAQIFADAFDMLDKRSRPRSSTAERAPPSFARHRSHV